MSDTVILEIDKGIARITLNRPDRGNALNQEMADALLAVALRCANDDAVRCVILSGRGRMFCVGGDVGDFASNSTAIAGFLSGLAGTLHQALAQFASMRKPLITQVNGPAAGAGMSMAISGDIALASDAAHFTAAYGGIGLTPDGGMTWMLPRLVGMRQAQDLILTNRRVDAAEAARIGLITRALPQDKLDGEAAQLAERLAAGAVASMGNARRLLHDSFSSGYSSQMDRELRAISEAGEGSEGREGISAFLEKRKPDFQAG